MKISTVPEMRNMDRQAVEKYGIIENLLMENAGLAVYSVMLQELGIQNKCFVILI